MNWEKRGGYGAGRKSLDLIKPPNQRHAGKLPCPNCGGKGMTLYQPPLPDVWMGIHPPQREPARWQKCMGCNGTGQVDDPRS